MEECDKVQPRKNDVIDPDIFQIIGTASDLLGLGEHIQRLFPIDRIKAKRRHSRMDKLRGDFRLSLTGARVALRALIETIQKQERNNFFDDYFFGIERDDFPVYSKALNSLKTEIAKMTNIAYELETVASNLREEVERYYRISDAGYRVLSTIKEAFEGRFDEILRVLEEVDRYLKMCSSTLDDSDKWRSF